MLIALVAAIVAMAVSGLGRGAHGFRQFFNDLRPGRREPAASVGTLSADRLTGTTEVAEGGVADIFDIGERPVHAYVEPSAGPLLRVTQRAFGSRSAALTNR